ncbi:MAG: mismatch-specific DNA-glycosylase [Thermodesulfobacteriota bacterium]|nr:mismatch-specific DNA-glycosylase [Thermodesulfobacteriota bacterium]
MPKPILPDLIKPYLKIVFCGRAVGPESARQKSYYAKPGNKFWPALYWVRFTPALLEAREYRTLLNYELGLTDLIKHLSGTDKRITVTDKDIALLKRKLSRYQPGILALNGKQAAKEFLQTKKVSYGRQNHKLGDTLIWVLPSTSSAANRYWNVDHWKNLKKIADKL